MKPSTWILVSASLGLMLPAACEKPDPAADFVRRVDAAPPEKRPPNWSEVKDLMARRAPAVGETAPDFTLPLLAGGQVTRSAFHESRPLVLIFGSFT